MRVVVADDNALIREGLAALLRESGMEVVGKCADPDDGRGALVHATDAGASLFRRIASAHGKAIAERMSLLSDDELTQLRDLTAKLRKKQPGC